MTRKCRGPGRTTLTCVRERNKTRLEQLSCCTPPWDSWGDNDSLSVLEPPVKTALYVPILPEVTDIIVTLVWSSHSVHMYWIVTVTPCKYTQSPCELKMKMSKKGETRLVGSTASREGAGEPRWRAGGEAWQVEWCRVYFCLWVRRWAWQGWQAIWEASCLGDIRAGSSRRWWMWDGWMWT